MTAEKKDLDALKAGLNPHWFEYTMRDGRVATIDRALTNGDFLLANHAGEMAMLKCIAMLVKVDGKHLTTTEWHDMDLDNGVPVIQEVSNRLCRALEFGRNR